MVAVRRADSGLGFAVGKPQLLAVNSDGSGVHVLVDREIDDPWGEFITGSLACSPYGTRILVGAGDRGGGSLYVVNADGSDLRAVAGGLCGAWSPDDSRIAVVHPSSPGAVLQTIKFEGTEIRTLTKKRSDGRLVRGSRGSRLNEVP